MRPSPSKSVRGRFPLSGSPFGLVSQTVMKMTNVIAWSRSCLESLVLIIVILLLNEIVFIVIISEIFLAIFSGSAFDNHNQEEIMVTDALRSGTALQSSLPKFRRTMSL